MNNPNDLSRFDGSMDRTRQDELIRSFETGVLPRDFPKRLERLKKASGLSWSGFARAVGVDPKQMHRWRNGAEPSGGAYHCLVRFAARIPGGLDILMGEGFQMRLFREES